MGQRIVEEMRSLEALIYPLSTEEFFRETWEQRPLLIPGKAEKFSPFLDGPKFLELLKEISPDRSKYHPHFELWKEEKSAPKPENWPQMLNESVWSEKADGSFHRKMREELGITTLRTRHLHRLDKALKGWAIRLLQDFDEGVSLNAYYSTGVKDIGVPWHADEGDVFILQIAGERRWQVSQNRPAKREDLNDKAPALHDGFDLRAGDLLYIPYNFPHRTQTLNSTFSLHLTVQILRRESSMVVAWLTEVLKEKLGARYETLFPLVAAEGEDALREKFGEIRSILGATLEGQDAFVHFQRYAFKEAGSAMWPKLTERD